MTSKCYHLLMESRKTKFILHGGGSAGKIDEDNTDFYKEILKDTPESAKVLLVPFAKDTERIPLAIERVTVEFNKNRESKNLTIETATEDNLIAQIRSADVVYFHGGTSLKLLEVLKKYPDLREAIKGKVVAGESAGANVFCTYFYSPNADGVFEGLGFLPLKSIPHYREEYKDKLNNVGLNLESLLLKEYEFKVFVI